MLNIKETLMQNAYAIASSTLLLNYYILGREKEKLDIETSNWRTMYDHYTHWTVCMYVFIAYSIEAVIVYVNC